MGGERGRGGGGARPCVRENGVDIDLVFVLHYSVYLIYIEFFLTKKSVVFILQFSIFLSSLFLLLDGVWLFFLVGIALVVRRDIWWHWQ